MKIHNSISRTLAAAVNTAFPLLRISTKIQNPNPSIHSPQEKNASQIYAFQKNMIYMRKCWVGVLWGCYYTGGMGSAKKGAQPLHLSLSQSVHPGVFWQHLLELFRALYSSHQEASHFLQRSPTRLPLAKPNPRSSIDKSPKNLQKLLEKIYVLCSIFL